MKHYVVHDKAQKGNDHYIFPMGRLTDEVTAYKNKTLSNLTRIIAHCERTAIYICYDEPVPNQRTTGTLDVSFEKNRLNQLMLATLS